MFQILFLLVVALRWEGGNRLPVAESPKRPSQTAEAMSASREIEVVEAVFLHQMERCYRDRSRKVYFLSYKKSDPAPELMERFQSYGPTVRKQSDRRQFLKERTGEAAVLLGIAGIERLNNSVIRVMGSCSAGLLDGYSYHYRVKKESGKWKVISQRLVGIS